MKEKMVKIADIAKLITKGTTPTTIGYEFQDTGINFLKIECFDENGNFIKEKAAHISEECNDKLKRSQLKKGDILFSIAGAIGRVAIVKDEMLPANTNQALAIIRIEDAGLYLPYIKLILTSKIVSDQIERKKQGVAQLNLSLKDIGDIEIPIPELEKQKEFVLLFSKIARLINSRKQELEELDNLIKSRFEEMFDTCTNEVLIGDVISISRGASPRPISEFITDDEDGVNWIKIGDVSENSLYITKTDEKITTEGAKKSRMVYKGDFILSNSMSFGRPYILGINGCVHDGWLIMSNFKDIFNELYLYYAIRSDDVQYQFSGKVNGATVKNLNSDLVKNTFIKVPPMELQEQFAIFVERTDKLKSEVQKSLEETQTLMDSLMQQYFG